MTPLDLKTKEEWEVILDGFAQETNMTACVTDDAGKQLLCRVDRYPFCAAVRDNREALTFICSQTNTAMLASVKQTLQPAVDACEVGLLRVVVPVVSDGTLVGQVTACGLAPDGEEIDAFLPAKQLNISEEEVEDLLRSTPAGSEVELSKHAGGLFAKLNHGGSRQ
jgi:ligand-binding sensor protein